MAVLAPGEARVQRSRDTSCSSFSERTRSQMRVDKCLRVRMCRFVFCMHIYKHASFGLSPGLLCNACTPPQHGSWQTVLAYCSATVKFSIIASQADSSELPPRGHTWNLRAFLRQRGVTRPETPLLLFLCMSPSSLSSLSFSLSIYLSYLFTPAFPLRSRVMGRTLSGKPISFSMFSYFYPIMACSEVSKAT